MNVSKTHAVLAEAGYDVISVSEDGRMEFATPKTPQDRLDIRAYLLNYKEPTRAEFEARILKDRDRLLDQLLLERFMPREEKDDAGFR